MKKLHLPTTVLVITFFFAGVALAGDSVNIKVSCTIPAIPGVNVPPFPDGQELSRRETTEQKTQEERKTYPIMVAENKAKNDVGSVIVQEDRRTQGQLSDDRELAAAVKTIYSR